MAKPPLRPSSGRGGGPNSKSVLTWAVFLLLIATATSQSVHQPEILNRVIASTKSLAADSQPSRRPTQAGRSPAEIPLLKNDITTINKFRSTDEDPTNKKLRALAPAYSDEAVRAPLAKKSIESSTTGGSISALPGARLLQDWEVENIVLIATIDGTIHARDRKTGNERWSLGIPNSPMIETIHHKFNRSDLDEFGAQQDDDYMFIVEPSKDGNLYVQHRDPRIGLQRLGVTVRSLVAETPQFVDDPPIVTISSQETTAYVVDAATGNILQQFDRYSSFSGDNQSRSCRRLSGFELDDPACDPIGTINLGRVEYTIQIAHKITNEPLCTIKFAEWLPNKMDIDLQSQYVAPLDNYHIQSFYNGRILGIVDDMVEGKIARFNQKFDTPVARVFDVVRPLDNHAESAKLVLLSRPMDASLVATSEAWQNDMQQAEKVFVNKTDAGGWYAMSELSYPGVTSGAAAASSNWKHDYALDFGGELDDIIGVHILSGQESPLPVRLTISAPPPVTDLAEEGEKAMSAMKYASPMATMPMYSLSTIISLIVSAVFVLVVGVQMKVPIMLKLQKHFRKGGIEISLSGSQEVSNTPISPITGDELPVAEVAEIGHQRNESVPVVAEVLASAMATPAHSRAHSVATTMASPLKGAKDEHDGSSDGESEDEKDKLEPSSTGSGENGAGQKKPKTRRGKRGGKKNRKAKFAMEPEAMDELDPAVAEVPTKDGLLQVGRLKLDTRENQCLGRGSNGTAVYPGTMLDGREVAVKRLIRAPNSLAAKEIKFLLSADQNPHVVRYFGKEEAQHFTYIALERFSASLDQFIEHPQQYPDLIKMPEGFDVKDALRQITDGVQHLHALKLVHRDIKPQNILVNAVKSNRPIVGLPKLHFVISDFGLCKRLEEGPESTFAPTANHTAAGTTGWRAPELLVAPRSLIAAPSVTSATSEPKSTTHSSDGTTLDPPSGRRVTKAIDIFSLGCVFYYVMTQGRHPYDVGGSSLGRDLNIRDNNFSTDDLRLHDYQFDADDLIMQMLKHDPKFRPTAEQILEHPYFWDVADKLEFLCEVSDCYEREKNSITDIHNPSAARTPLEKESLAELDALELLADNVIGRNRDFLRALPKSFVQEMGKQRKYTGSKMIDLLRVIRNKKNHFHDLPENVKEEMLGGSARGYFEFWARRFPSLLINCHCLVLERGLVRKFKMERWFQGVM